MLDNATILVVEDQLLIALDLALAVEDAGGQVLGPAASGEEALALLAATPVAAAILDVNLIGGDCSAVVEALASAGVPMIVQTSVGLPPAMATRFPGLMLVIKPCVAAKLVAVLEVLIADDPRTTAVRAASRESDEAAA